MFSSTRGQPNILYVQVRKSQKYLLRPIFSCLTFINGNERLRLGTYSTKSLITYYVKDFYVLPGLDRGALYLEASMLPRDFRDRRTFFGETRPGVPCFPFFLSFYLSDVVCDPN